ncbi:MAG: DUF1456 family protein [Desulfamplus sp.]|nr:DUF1456 family protein [Desulfamplus sp.]
MQNNDVLRIFRYALNIPDTTMVNIFTTAGCKIDRSQLLNLLKKREEPNFVSCSSTLLEKFFDGLIIYNRGRQDDEPLKSSNQSVNRGKPQPESLSNNLILKKIRIALDLKQDDMIEIFRLGNVNVTKGEFTAMFRKEGHKNYKECGDQYMKKFLQGLAVRHRV